MMTKKYYVVYPKGIDDVEKEAYAHSGIDPEVALCKRIAASLTDAEVCDDEKIHDNEILVGETDRPETAAALSRLGDAQYGVFVMGDRVAVCGHCVAATVMAAELLLTVDPEQLTDGFALVKTCEKWFVDYSRPADGVFVGMSDACFDRAEWVWDQVGAKSVDDYRAALARDGYETVWENRIGENRFYRYQKEGVYLQVAYWSADRTLRVISGKLSQYMTAPQEWRLDGACDKPVTLTQMTFDYACGSFGMCYILTLADGSFVILDGGHVRVAAGQPKTYDYLRLYTLLREMNTREDGRIVIRAWLMTHEHADHFNVFYWFCRFCHDYGQQVTVQTYCACPCSDTVAYNAKNPEFHTSSGKLAKAREWIGGFDVAVLHSGDVLRFGELSFEILYTVDELYPTRLRYFNDSSFVAKMTYGGQSTMWLGDICTAPSAFLRKHYGADVLRSDIVQLAHHGLNGAEEELYGLIGAEVLLWSLWDRLVKNILEEEPKEPHHALSQRLAADPRVKEILKHTRHNYTLSLPYIPGKSEQIKR